MDRYFLAAISALVLGSNASAADMPTKASPYAPVPAWAGLYLGIQGGVARHDGEFADINCTFGCSTFKLNDTGGAFGGHLGYNWQHGGFVYGLEGDFSWVGANSRRLWNSCVTCTDTNEFTTLFDVKWLATIRGRAGLTFDATLLYITGGPAFGQVSNSAISHFDSGAGLAFTITSAETETRVGWTAGFGIEHMFSPNWTGRAEFRYVDLGRTTVTASCTSSFLNCSVPTHGEFSNTLTMGLIGLSYKF